MNDIETLAARVEALTGPDREVDEAIADLVYTNKRRTCIAGLSDEDGGMWMWETPDGHIQNALRFTFSLDAAMTLVPKGMGFDLNRYWIAGADGPVWSSEIATGGLPDKPRKVFDCYDRPSAALAVAAAALRAIAKERGE